MRTLLRSAAAPFTLGVLWLAAACSGGATPLGDGTLDAGAAEDGGASDAASQSVPRRHFAAPVSCTVTRTVRPAGSDAGAEPMECRYDSDCTEKPNGQCTSYGNTPLGCVYDQCLRDEDCASDKACSCGELGGSQCVPAECRSDGDCGEGQFCAESGKGDVNPPGKMTLGRFCTTSSDECRRDSDCGPSGSAVPNKRCDYSTESARWECKTINVVAY